MNFATTPYTSYLLIGVSILLILWFIITYNKFISLRRFKDEAWSGISAQLKRRHDLLPNLLLVVNRYAEHEKKVFEQIAKQRSEMMTATNNTQDVANVEKQVNAVLGRIFALAEAYPELKSSQNFLSLQDSLNEIEEQLQMARRYYNGTVRDLNILVESFPSLIVAKIGHFKTAEFFELDDPSEAKVPSMA